MTFDELLEEIYLITNRRDLVAESKSALKRSTLKGHKTDFYPKDIFEEGIQFPDSKYLQSFDPYTTWSNFRSWKYFKRVDLNQLPSPSGEYVSVPIEILTVDETLDSYGCAKADIAYEAGRMLEIRSSVDFTKAIVGCYLLPIVVEDNYNSWLAEQYPYFIIHESARLIFASIGKIEESRAQAGLVAEELAELKLGATVTVGS
jgi:hypothetical protein